MLTRTSLAYFLTAQGCLNPAWHMVAMNRMQKVMDCLIAGRVTWFIRRQHGR